MNNSIARPQDFFRLEFFLNGFRWNQGGNTALIFGGTKRQSKDGNYTSYHNTTIQLNKADALYAESLHKWIQDSKANNQKAMVFLSLNARWNSYEKATGGTYGDSNKPKTQAVTNFQGWDLMCVNPSNRSVISSTTGQHPQSLDRPTDIFNMEFFLNSFMWNAEKKSAFMFGGVRRTSRNGQSTSVRTAIRLNPKEAEYVESIYNWMQEQRSNNLSAIAFLNFTAKWASYKKATGATYGADNKPVTQDITYFEGWDLKLIDSSSREVISSSAQMNKEKQQSNKPAQMTEPNFSGDDFDFDDDIPS
jgi:hypothetical protein